MTINVTLDMRVPNGTGGWTLAEAVKDLKQHRMTRLLVRDTEEVSELLGGFLRAVRDDQTPSIGQVWAAYHTAVSELLFEQCYVEDVITERQYAARMGALTKLVFRRVWK